MIIHKIFVWFVVLLLNDHNCNQMMATASYTPHKTVELAVFIDQYLYHYWFSTLKRSPVRTPGGSSTLSMQQFIRSYLEVLLESLNLIYAHPSLASSSSSPAQEVPLIGFHLAHTEIFWKREIVTDPSTPFYHSTSQTRKQIWEASSAAPNYLETFCDFANKANWNGNRWDHALLLTGVDLKFLNGTNYSVAGISWDNSMCNKKYSCSVVEAKTFRSVMTAVHEIGHSLGMEHDGRKHNFKCPSSGYIMSHAGGGEDSNNPVGKIAWSPCSKYNLKSFLTTAPNVLSNQVACLNNKPEIGRSEMSMSAPYSLQNMRGGRGYETDHYRKVIEPHGILPGARFSVFEQCKLGGGGKWRPSIRRAHIRKLCLMLYCNNTRTAELVPFHPALEGTSCGRNKICKYGECVPIQVIVK